MLRMYLLGQWRQAPLLLAPVPAPVQVRCASMWNRLFGKEKNKSVETYHDGLSCNTKFQYIDDNPKKEINKRNQQAMDFFERFEREIEVSAERMDKYGRMCVESENRKKILYPMAERGKLYWDTGEGHVGAKKHFRCNENEFPVSDSYPPTIDEVYFQPFKMLTWRESLDGSHGVAIVGESPSLGTKIATFPLPIKNSTQIRYIDTEAVVTNIELVENDSAVFFTQEDNLIPFCVKAMDLNKGASSIRTVYEESDRRYFVDISKSFDDEFLFVNCNRKDASEIQFISVSNAMSSSLRTLIPRNDSICFVEHRNGMFYFLTNEGDAVNFTLMSAPAVSPQRSNWKTIVPHSEERMITDGAIIDKHFVLHCTDMNMEEYLLLINLETEEIVEHRPAEEYKYGKLSFHPTYDPSACTRTLLVECTLAQGEIVYWKCNFETPAKVNETGSDVEVVSSVDKHYFDTSKYRSEVLRVSSHDNVAVPMTIVYDKAVDPRKEPKPVLLRAYGAYGVPVTTSCGFIEKSFLKSGWIVAFAHVRGGGELGREWYNAGRREKKENSILDYLGCANYLVERGLTRRGLVVGIGHSAGGFTIASACNRDPAMFAALIMKAPFVDVLNTMMDTSQALTLHEREEWGDPINSKDDFLRLRELCPVQTLTRQPYPPIHISLCADDMVVPVSQGLKYVRCVEEMNTMGKDNPIVVLIHDDGGHDYMSSYATASQYMFAYLALMKRRQTDN
eukprot:m.105880 g.105880  ORF g.105880 m.105880 type:complete len:733 (-) comp12665_c0_seq2:57-2255(-)